MAFLQKPALRAALVMRHLTTRLYASFRICLFLTARLSADDSRMAVLKSAFGAKMEVFGQSQDGGRMTETLWCGGQTNSR